MESPQLREANSDSMSKTVTREVARKRVQLCESVVLYATAKVDDGARNPFSCVRQREQQS